METARALYSNLLAICLLIVALAAAKSAVAGQPDITNVTVSVTADKKVSITYDLASSSVQDNFNIQIAVFSGHSIAPLLVSQLSGDVGQTIRPGMGKTVVWDARADGYVLDGDYYVEVSATMRPQVRTGSHLTQSMLFPGLGDYRLRNGSLYFLYGVGFYGSLYGAWYYNDLAKQEYIRYQQATEIDMRNELYDNTNTYALYATTLLSTAAFIYITDNTGILMKSRRLRRRDPIEPSDSKYYHRLSQQPYSGKSTATPLNTKTQYDYELAKAYKAFDTGDYESAATIATECLQYQEADINEINNFLANVETAKLEAEKLQAQYNRYIEAGDSLLALKQYDAAQQAYEASLVLLSDKEYPKRQIIVIQNEKTTIAYNALIADADELFGNGELDAALLQYDAALALKPSEPYPVNQKKLIADKKLEMAKEAEYMQFVATGDSLFSLSEYTEAIIAYDKASTIKAGDRHLIQKRAEAVRLKNEAEANDVGKIYDSIIVIADRAFEAREIDIAITHYKTANKVMPTDEYALKHIRFCENSLNRMRYTDEISVGRVEGSRIKVRIANPRFSCYENNTFRYEVFSEKKIYGDQYLNLLINYVTCDKKVIARWYSVSLKNIDAGLYFKPQDNEVNARVLGINWLQEYHIESRPRYGVVIPQQ